MEKFHSKLLILSLMIVLVLVVTGCDLLNQISDSVKTGIVSGTVVDESGNAIVGATVKVGTKSDTTNDSGLFYIEGLETGKVTLTITKDGFQTLDKGITIGEEDNKLGELVLTSDSSDDSEEDNTNKKKFVFNPKEDYPLVDLSDVKEMHLVGEMNDWDPADKTYALEQQDDGTWTAEFAIPEGTKYKILFDTTSWKTLQEVPAVIDNVLVVGQENNDGKVGSYSFALDVAKANEVAFAAVNDELGTTDLSVSEYQWNLNYQDTATWNIKHETSDGTVDSYEIQLSYSNGNWNVDNITVSSSDSTPTTASLSGVVVDSSGNPLSNAKVAIGQQVVETGSDGSFSVEGLAVELKTLTISLTGYLSFSTDIDLVAGSNNLGEIILEKDSSDSQLDIVINNFSYSKTSDGLWKINLELADNPGVSEIGEIHLVGDMNSWAPADKSYTLTKGSDGLTWTGEFNLTAGSEFKFMYDNDTWDGNKYFGQDGTSSSNNFIIQTTTTDLGSVSGTVVDEQGSAIANATVILGTSTGTELKATTDSTGQFEFADVPTGETFLGIGTIGYQITNKTINVTSGSNGLGSITLLKAKILISDLDINQTSSGEWKISLQLADTTEARNIGEIHLVGKFQSWDPADKTYALNKGSDELTWTGTFTVSSGDEFLFVYDSTQLEENVLDDGSNSFIIEEITDYSY